MGVVRLIRRDDFLSGIYLARDPEGLEICHRAAAAEMAEVLLPAEHCGDLRDGFFFGAELARPPSSAWLLGLIQVARA